MDENSDVWLGWTYWAGGAWWSDDYFASVQPLNGKDRPQMAILEKYTKPDPVTP
jgi:endoglucanase